MTVKQCDWLTLCCNAIDNDTRCHIPVNRTGEVLAFIWRFALHVLFNGLFKKVVIILNNNSSRWRILHLISRSPATQYGVVVKKIDRVYVKFINPKTRKTYTVYVCTPKDHTTMKRRKTSTHDNTLVLCDNSPDDNTPGRIKIMFELIQ